MLNQSLQKLTFLIVVAVTTTFTGFAAIAATSGITYQGRILKPDGTPLTGTNVQFKIQIRTPDANNCLMYEETQLLDMHASNGVFALTVNDGTGTRTDATGFNLDRIFSNAQGTANTFTFNPATCTTGSTYLPNSGDGRTFVVSFKDETMAAYEPMPAQKINFIPLAFEAKQIAGFTPASLVRVAEADGTLGSVSPLSNANYTELLSLINGTTVQYEKAGKISGVAVPSMTTGQVLGWNGSSWTSVDPASGVQTFAKTVLPTCGAGQFLKDNGSGLLTCATPGGSGGTVTQVNTGTGLTGGGFTTSGTISISAGGVGATELAANAVTTAKIADANVTLAKLAANSVDSSKIVDGSIAGADLDPAINITTSGTVVSGVNTTRDFKLFPAGAGTKKISFAAPVALAADYTITFPLTAGGASQVLTTDGSGNLSWSTPAGTGISALTGDVTASGSGSVAATVASVGGVTAANVAAGANLANAATNLNTASAIVKRDASGNFAAGNITQTSSIYKDSGANTVTLQAPTTVTTSYVLKLPAAVAASAGQVLSSDTSGNLSWFTLPTTAAPSGAAGGDLSGTYPNPSVATVGTVTAANIASGANAANAATAVNTASKIVARDASANFAANVATLNGVALNNAGSVLNITNPVGGAWNMTLPATAGTSGQVMQTNGSGVMSWMTPVSTATGFVNGGNSFGANASIGTNDAFRLDVKTNNAVAMTIDSTGKVGIGTTAPSYPLTVVGGMYSSGNLTVNGFEQQYTWSNTAYTPTSSSSNNPANVAVSINNSDTTAGDAISLAFTNKNGAANAYISAVSGAGATSALAFGQQTGATAYAERMRIDTTGNVGIGTTAPTAIFDISSGNNPTFVIGANQGSSMRTNGLDKSFLMTTPVNASAATFTVLNGISTAANNSLNVGGGSAFAKAATDINFYTAGNTNTNTGTLRMVVDSNGNVGVGTAPATKLQVAGTVMLGDGGETCGASYAGGVRYNGGNIQFCNGTSWSTLGVAGAGITALTGDVTASGTGSVAATVANVGGSTAAAVNTATVAANAATDLNTASTIVKRDASGNFSAGTATLGSASVASVVYRSNSGPPAHFVTVSASPSVTTSYGLQWPAAVASAAGQVLSSDTSGNMSWSSLPTALPPNGSAGGDLSGSYPNPTVATVGTSTAAQVHSAELAANAATAANTASTIVSRDGTGNFAANVATVNGVALKNAGSILNITNPVGGAWNMTLPATAGLNGQVMQTNGSGVMTWATPLTGTTGFLNGGNSFGANASFGTNDSFRLDVKTNNVARMTFDSSGNVGIGTTSPSKNLAVQGTTQTAAIGIYPSAIGSGSSSTLYLNDDATFIKNAWGSGLEIAENGPTNIHSADYTFIYTNIGYPLKLGTNSTERLRIDPTGNVGIGTTAPASLLEVDSTSTSTSASNINTGSFNTTIQPTAANGPRTSLFTQAVAPNTVSAAVGDIKSAWNYANSEATTTTSSVTAIRNWASFGGGSSPLVDSGYFGAFAYGGTVTNLNGLDILAYNSGAGGTVGTMTGMTIETDVNGPVTNRYGVYLKATGAASGNDFGFYEEGTQKNYFAGNVGIGTTDPLFSSAVGSAIKVLGISGDGSASNFSEGLLRLGNNRATPVAGDFTGEITFMSQGNPSGKTVADVQTVLEGAGGASGYGAYMAFLTKSDNGGIGERLRINSSGNVGIGTTAPGSKLQIGPNPAGYGGVDLVVSNSNGSVAITNGSGYAFVTANQTLALQTTGGLVGIGITNPTYQLQLSTDSAAKPGTSTWTIASDARLKNIRAPFTRGLESLMGLDTIYFSYKPENPLGLPSDKEYVGIRAQDVQKVIPEAVSVDAKGYLHVTNDSIIWTAVNSIKELYRRVLGIDSRVQVLENEVAQLKAENQRLKADEVRMRAIEERLSKVEKHQERAPASN